ncbi:serine/threonine-protein kinase pim-3-like [Triplophysa rosa]|uniref:serine/threonine-protein kinase pim-3-like n=1 Tax=Triplophysa rosa TaxID=992332 RepID=UPI002545FFE4|nr:serine/threonine-protein kinase pim-3-like [Triplophysa rosa]
MTDVAMLIKLQQPPTSPYVIRMFEWFDYRDHIKIVMEYPAPCLELITLISRQALNEQRVRVIMRQAVQAVNHCLDHGVFHNDIHTGNILVNTRTFNIKLIDFGCALEYTGKPYPNHKYRGAYDYWPPEVKGKAAFEGKTTNVYHLGKLLQKMFPGCRPGVSQGESSDKNTVTHS